MAKEVSKTFRMDEACSSWLSKSVMDLDCSLSDLIRTSLILAVPLIKVCPAIMRRIDLEDFKSQQD